MENSTDTNTTDLNNLENLLGNTLRIKMSDGRVIEGQFQCMDKDLNFILGSATEYHGMTNVLVCTDGTHPSRYLGMAMVPGAFILGIYSLNELRLL